MNSMGSGLTYRRKLVFSDKLGQNIVDKSTKISSIGFSIVSFTAEFWHFCSTTANIWLLHGGLSTCLSITIILGISLKFEGSKS